MRANSAGGQRFRSRDRPFDVERQATADDRIVPAQDSDILKGAPQRAVIHSAQQDDAGGQEKHEHGRRDRKPQPEHGDRGDADRGANQVGPRPYDHFAAPPSLSI